MTIGAFLTTASTALLKVGILTARLDTLVLLGDAFNKDKSWLLAHLDDTIPGNVEHKLHIWLNQRLKRTPLAYIRGHQEFFGRDFTVTPSVLIPRPDTEALVENIRSIQPASLLDVGTGSGAIAITTALELPNCIVEACDISVAALTIAAQNAAQLNAKVTFFESNLLDHASRSYHMIAANLPYVDILWERSPETTAEPAQALFADDSGLALIKRLIDTAPIHLQPKGYLLLEADPRQHAAIIAYSRPAFTLNKTVNFVMILQKN